MNMKTMCMLSAVAVAYCATAGASCPDAQKLAAPDAGKKCVHIIDPKGGASVSVTFRGL